MAEGDLRAAMFVLHHIERRRNPARVLAKNVVRLRRRLAAPPPAPTPPAPPDAPPASRPAADPLERQAQRAGASLRDALVREHGTKAAALKAEPEPVREAVAAGPNRRQRRALAAVRRRTRAPEPPPRDGRPQPRSRGP